ncbi:MAG TPA: potassium transporter Kup [Accumulibacter sp.]|uniref:potassium transporter Kup n=1 Tax=Accumulibacter sp. TaxID=2053492 RepID=UPI0026103F0B|nr:potassium transporter Kup [Accumulibacter sp.]HMV04562.1 potassium transporter Kup [Accumulibacter sp.]HMW63754.1 potassium transporter Kup [Accumulibacter sp.]HMW79724.1 potassium transporter Kup [Accumulibacter sp.]HNB66468.1 potassium transporter Kup [Accumulibacter sp.]HNC27177.1 potassium transporter Kup [Accumulibacter sp.]
MTAENAPHGGQSGLAATALAAMGVVFGDIGTSPLYTVREVFGGHHPVAVTPDNVLGILSLVFWAMTITVSMKYVLVITRADNKGEGGIMALTALALRTANASPRVLWLLSLLGIFGAALFYGDAVITPAMSVLSAVEGLEVITPLLKAYILPITVTILVLLFFFQRNGTAAVGALFGPVMMLWFATLGVLGLWNVLQYPEVLAAINPWYAIRFFVDNQGLAFLALGSVVLAITGGEALYADMGHFGRRAIKWAWFAFVFPLLYLNYLGQGALLLHDPKAIENPFFLLAPSELLLVPLVVLATAATVIASQAVISGAFSLTSQAMQLGYCPRIQVKFTSEREKGQIYVPNINWLLLLSVIVVVVGFRSSSNLAAAYGIAVTLTMMIDTILAFVVVRALWKWNWTYAALFLLFFVIVDFAFFSANVTKILDGGWFPLVLGLSVFALLSTWKLGRKLLYEKLQSESIPLDAFIESLATGGPQRVEGTGIFMTAEPQGVPRALLHNLYHNKILHKRVVLINVVTEDVPHVPDDERVRVETLSAGFFRVFVRYGFKDDPDVPRVMDLCATQHGLRFEMMETSFFLGRETVVTMPISRRSRMAYWRQILFTWMFRNADTATAFFKIPPNRVVELGAQVELS